jgi:hypothetical protein
MDGDKPNICPLHIALATEVTEVHTILKIEVENQKKMIGQLEEIHKAIADAKLVAITDLKSLTSEIDKDRIKIKPLYAIVGIAGTAGIYELWHWIRTLFLGK